MQFNLMTDLSAARGLNRTTPNGVDAYSCVCATFCQLDDHNTNHNAVVQAGQGRGAGAFSPNGGLCCLLKDPAGPRRIGTRNVCATLRTCAQTFRSDPAVPAGSLAMNGTQSQSTLSVPSRIVSPLAVIRLMEMLTRCTHAVAFMWVGCEYGIDARLTWLCACA